VLSGGLLLVLVAAPLAGLAIKAGLVVDRSGEVLRRGWSAAAALRNVAWAPVVFRREFGWALVVALAAAALAVLAAAPLAWAARSGRWRAWPGWLIAAWGASLPGPVLGVVLIWAFNRPGPLGEWLYDRTTFVPTLALGLRGLPWAFVCLWAAFRTFPERVIEAARLEGARWPALLGRVVLPALWPEFGLAYLLAFLLAAGDVSTSILLLPPGVTTLAVRIFDRLHTGADEQVAGVCLAVVAVYLTAAMLARWALRSTQKRRGV
jgi:iron(III) transport system permease protein